MVSLCRLLLRLYPPAFRRRFGDDMAATFEDRWLAARREGTPAIAFAFRISADAVRHGLAERRLERRRAGRPRRMERLMSVLAQDLRNAWRGLARQPAFALLSAAMLAVGLVFNITLFAIVDAAILRPLPYRDADRLVLLWSGLNPDGTAAVSSPADYEDWRARARSFERMAAFNISLGTLTGDEAPEEVRGSIVTREFFDILAARPLVGRTFSDEDYAQQAERPIVISESLWRRRYGGDEDIVNRLITLSDQPRRVIGVMPGTLLHPEPFWYREADYWSPFVIADGLRANRSSRFIRVIARVDEDATLDAARAEMDAIGRQLMEEHPDTNTTSVLVVTLADQLVGDTRPLFWLFLGASALVLFLAATNIVNLMLARANRRRYELAVRTALGAGRWRLARQMALEGALVGGLAGAVGLLLAATGVPLVVQRAPVNLPGLADAGLNPRVLAFGIVLSVVAGTVCGLVPAARVARARLTGTLTGARGTSGLETTRARTWLVIAEIAVATPLVVGALLLGQTLFNLQRVDPGFDPGQALAFRVSLASQRYADAESRVAFFRSLEDGLRALPGASAAGIVTSLPMGGLNNTGGVISSAPAPGAVAREVSGGFRYASSGYFDALGIEIVRGAAFGDGAEDLGTAVVNERLARELWGDENPVGRQVRLGAASATSPSPWHTVVGVARDVRHVRLTQPPDPEVFFPYAADPWTTMSAVVRTETPAGNRAAAVRDLVRRLDPDIAVVGLMPVADVVAGGWARARFGALSAVLFACIGLLLAAGGTFAVLSLLVAARRREIGIRLALGAAPHQVRRLVLRQAMLPAVAGCAAGAAIAWGAAGLLAATLFDVEPRDPLAFGAALGALALAALAASWMPARRAMRVAPSSVMRDW